MDINNPELDRIFREELTERSNRLVQGARALAGGKLSQQATEGLIRDAHTIKGSASLMEREPIREAAARLEELWRRVSSEGTASPQMADQMEALALRMLHGEDTAETKEAAPGPPAAPPESPVGLAPVRSPEVGSLGGLLTSVSDSLLSGVTRVDTSELYRLINRIVEVALDAEAIADLSLVSIEGADPDAFRKSWRSQLAALAESIADIQDHAVALANVSFFDAASTFPQFVRYLGRRAGKDVRFELIGHDIELDRQIIDLIREPLRHLLVNAVDHGIEKPDARVALGKPATGVVRLAARIIDDQVEIALGDDGRGIDWDRVVEVAESEGRPAEIADLTPVLLQPGFTTLADPSEFSGSGEGLAGAADAVAQVHGAINIESQKDVGTVVTLTLPMSMVLQNIVVVADGDRFWGLPEASVEGSMPLATAEMTTSASRRQVKFESAAIPCLELGETVGAARTGDDSEILFINTRSGMVGVTVNEIVDRRRVAVKNLGPILESNGAVKGAAQLGGGQVLIVLDPDFIGLMARQRPHAVTDRPRILVVDDSAGVRQLLSATLTGAGFEVEVAGAAREAVVLMAQESYAAMVVDYSMPRSNGVELVRAMRAADVKIPIVMVSGVASQAEKDAAWQAGVDAYLDKFDLRQGVLTDTLKRLIGEGQADTA